VMPGLEVIRVTKPLRHIGCERLIIFGDPDKNDSKVRIYYEYNEEIKHQLKDLLKGEEITHVDVDLYDFEAILSNLCRIIKEEKERKNLVFVNVSCGSKIFVAAAVMASMMYGAVPYFSRRIGFRTKTKDFEENGRPAGIAKDTDDPVEIPTFELKPPEPVLIVILSAIKDLREKHKIVRQGDIIKGLHDKGIMDDVYEVEKPSSKKQTVLGIPKVSRHALNQFKTQYFNKMVENGWVATKGYGRRVEVHLTERGEQMLRIFCHLR